jgi:hypothetical protein
MAAALGMLTITYHESLHPIKGSAAETHLNLLGPGCVALTISTAKLGAACRSWGNKKRADLSPVSGSSTLVRHGRL